MCVCVCVAFYLQNNENFEKQAAVGCTKRLTSVVELKLDL